VPYIIIIIIIIIENLAFGKHLIICPAFFLLHQNKILLDFLANNVHQNHAAFKYSIKQLAMFSAAADEICNKQKSIGSADESASHRKYITTTLYCYR
jgi:hypothetical protein